VDIAEDSEVVDSTGPGAVDKADRFVEVDMADLVDNRAGVDSLAGEHVDVVADRHSVDNPAEEVS